MGRPADEDGAGAALAQLAAVLGAHEAEVLAEDLQQRVVDGGQDLAVLAVHPSRSRAFSKPVHSIA